MAAPPAIVKDKSGEGGQTAVRLDLINEGVKPDVLQRGRAGMARQRSKDVRAATWNVSSKVRFISVVLKRRGGRVKVRRCLVLMVEDISYFCKAVISTRNAEGERILEFDGAVGIVVCNTFFKKEDYANYLPVWRQ